MDKTEFCSIRHGQDRKRTDNLWWEAILVTPKGESLLQRVPYRDRKYANNLGNGIANILPATFESFLTNQNLESARLRRSAHDRLVATLMEAGWEPAAADQSGQVTSMKRVSKP